MNTHHFTPCLSSSRPGVLTSPRANWPHSRPKPCWGGAKGKFLMSGTCLGALRGKNDFWANSGVCSNYHFAIAHPLHPLHPWGWGLQGVSFFLHPWAGGSHAFKTTKLLKVITFDHFYKRNHYSFEHSSFYILAFIQSPWGVDQHQSKIWHPRTCLGTLREKI